MRSTRLWPEAANYVLPWQNKIFPATNFLPFFHIVVHGYKMMYCCYYSESAWQQVIRPYRQTYKGTCQTYDLNQALWLWFSNNGMPNVVPTYICGLLLSQQYTTCILYTIMCCTHSSTTPRLSAEYASPTLTPPPPQCRLSARFQSWYKSEVRLYIYIIISHLENWNKLSKFTLLGLLLFLEVINIYFSTSLVN